MYFNGFSIVDMYILHTFQKQTLISWNIRKNYYNLIDDKFLSIMRNYHKSHFLECQFATNIQVVDVA